MSCLQVLEQNVKWKAAVIQTTLHSAGAAILPHKKVIMKIIAALFAAPSKVQVPQNVFLTCTHCMLAGPEIHVLLALEKRCR